MMTLHLHSEPSDRGGGHWLWELGGVCAVHDRGRQEQVPLHPGDVQGQDPQRGPVAPGQGDNPGDKEDKDTSYFLTSNKCV